MRAERLASSRQPGPMRLSSTGYLEMGSMIAPSLCCLRILVPAIAAAALGSIATTAVHAQPGIRTIPLPQPTATLPTEFTSVGAVRELADGRLLIVDPRDQKLLVADLRNGTAVQIGRNQRQPGLRVASYDERLLAAARASGLPVLNLE